MTLQRHKTYIALLVIGSVLITTTPTIAETLYVRPGPVTYGDGSGSSYSSALSGVASIQWGEGAGVLGPNDTLIVCGKHTSTLTIGTSGTSGRPIVIDGDCPRDPGSIVVSAPFAVEQRSNPEGRSYITIQNLRLVGGTSSTVHCNGSASGQCLGNKYINNYIEATVRADAVGGITVRNPKNVTIKGNVLNGAGKGAKGITLDDPLGQPYPANSGNLVTKNSVYGWYWYGIRFLGLNDQTYIENPGVISYNTVHNNGDGIYLFRTSGVRVEYNISYANTDTSSILGEGYGLASTRSINGTWKGNVVYNNRTKGLEPWIDDLSRPSAYMYIVSNLFYGNGTGGESFHCAIHVSNNGIAENFKNTYIVGNVVVGSQCGINVYRGVTGVVANNTIYRPLKEAGIFLGQGADQLILANNILVTGAVPGIVASSSGVGTNLLISSNLYDEGVPVLASMRGQVYTAATITNLDPLAKLESVKFLDVDTHDFRLTSPVGIRNGKSGYYCVDIRSRECYAVLPDIGAYQHTAGDMVP